MKKVLLIFLIFCSLLSVKAENEKYYHMPFEIAYFDNWFNDYPVIIGTYGFNFVKEFSASESYLYSAITSINGESTQYKNSGEIIDMCMKSDTLQLELCKKASGKKHYFKCDMIQENNWDLPPFNIKQTQSIPFERYTGSYPEEIRVFSSPGIDFSQYNTYDFVITGNDPLEDQAILQTFARQDLFKGMVRDEESPDLIITIAKNADESISATYVPPTSQVVQSGSITTPVYNYITHKHSWVTKNQTSIHKTEGYTQTTKTSNIYLEISILDTKQMLQKGQNTPPIVWQMKFNKTYTNSTMQPIDIYNSILSWSVYPFKSYIYKDIFYLKKRPAAIWDENHIITKVYDNDENSDFLQEGDQILAINGKKELTIKTTAIWNNGRETQYIQKYRLDGPAGLHWATNYFLFFLSRIYTETPRLPELGWTCKENRITNNFGGKRSFTVLRNGKKKRVKGILFPLDDVKEYADIDKSDFNKYFNRFIEGKK